jgi:hypothetical protein
MVDLSYIPDSTVKHTAWRPLPESRSQTGRRAAPRCSACKNLPPHVLGAEELGRYLVYKWGQPITYRSVDEKRLVRQALNGRFGVVWFSQCYRAKKGNLSDHIDMWNGYHYMNELLKKSAGGNASAADDLFARSAGGVCFFQM